MSSKKHSSPAYHELLGLWKNLLTQGLRDDGWEWDWTTLGTLRAPVRNGGRARARIIAKAPGVWAGEGLVAAVSAMSADLGGPISARALVSDRARVRPGQVVSEWSGAARTLLALERPFLNLASYVSGIATQTSVLVAAVARAAGERKLRHLPRVTSTRKTLPGYRDAAIHGVRSGGGYPHRVSLSGGVLIKENHIAAAGSVVRAITGAREVAPHGLNIQVEVTNLKELVQALEASADGVLLDNFKPAQVVAALAEIEHSGRTVFVEISGGLTVENIGEYVLEGVHVLSSGGLTHSVRALDLSLLL